MPKQTWMLKYTAGLAGSEKLCKEVIAQAPDSPSATEVRQLMRKIQDARK